MSNEPNKIVRDECYSIFEGKQLEDNPHLNHYCFCACEINESGKVGYGVYDLLHDIWRDMPDWETANKTARMFVNVVRDYYSTPPEIKHYDKEEVDGK